MPEIQGKSILVRVREGSSYRESTVKRFHEENSIMPGLFSYKKKGSHVICRVIIMDFY